jgi:hypothetical protein
MRRVPGQERERDAGVSRAMQRNRLHPCVFDQPLEPLRDEIRQQRFAERIARPSLAQVLEGAREDQIVVVIVAFVRILQSLLFHAMFPQQGNHLLADIDVASRAFLRGTEHLGLSAYRARVRQNALR